MSSLLPANATTTEKALEATTNRTTDLPVPLRQLWNPDTCPADLLPWLAWAMSVDSWQPYWPEAVKRARIKQAISIQRHKGTAKSVRDTVASFGRSLAIREWWEKSPQGTPHTFELTLSMGSSTPNTAAYQQDIIDEINRVKPVRSHFTFTAGISTQAVLRLGGIGYSATYHRLHLSEAPFTGRATLHGRARSASYQRLTAKEV